MNVQKNISERSKFLKRTFKKYFMNFRDIFYKLTALFVMWVLQFWENLYGKSWKSLVK